jgi:hypothetical protein
MGGRTRAFYWRRDGDGRSTMHPCKRVLDPSGLFSNLKPDFQDGERSRLLWLLWMAEKSACPPLAFKKRGSDDRSEVWQTWGPAVKRIMRQVKAHPEVWASRRVVPQELDVGNWGDSMPYRPSDPSNSPSTVEMGVSALHSAVSRYVGRHRERLWLSSNVAESHYLLLSFCIGKPA